MGLGCSATGGLGIKSRVCAILYSVATLWWLEDRPGQVERWTECLLRRWLSRILSSRDVDNAARLDVDATLLRGHNACSTGG